MGWRFGTWDFLFLSESCCDYIEPARLREIGWLFESTDKLTDASSGMEETTGND
jgi:hypothetical protein